jgi:hypothetical protein
MAITTFYLPQILTPTFNPVGLSVTSTNQTKQKFQVLYDVYSANTLTRLFREKAQVGPDGYCKSNIQSRLKDYLSYDLVPSSTGITSSVPSRVGYYVQIGEEYVHEWDFDDNYFYTGQKLGFTSATNTHSFSVGDRVFVDQDPGYQWEQYNGVHTVIVVPDSNSIVVDVTFTASTADPGVITFADSRTTKFTGLTTVSGLTVNNAAFGHLDWLDYTVDDYNLTAGTATFFCDAPAQYEMSEDSRAWINFFISSAVTIRQLVVQTLDNGGNQLGYYTINAASMVSAAQNYYKVGVGPWNITNTAFIASGSSTMPIMQDNVFSYKVWIEDVSLNDLTEHREFKLDHRCSRYDNNISICFLDRKGAFISKEFQLGRGESDDISKEEYKRPIGEFNGSTYGYNSYERGRTIYNVDVTTKNFATSNYVSENDANYLRQLFSSPEVYWNDGGIFKPIIIKNKFYKVPSKRIDKLFNVSIEFELAYRNAINV